jgi:hypothetical protein
MGEDGGCFAAALTAVRNYSGVLEHPAHSHAWRWFGLALPPARGGWVRADDFSGWTCYVEQGHYSHMARKATWLYAYGLTPPSLRWGPGAKPEAWISADRPRAELAALGIAQLGKKEAKATPPEFRELLLSIARKAHNAELRGRPLADGPA